MLDRIGLVAVDLEHSVAQGSFQFGDDLAGFSAGDLVLGTRNVVQHYRELIDQCQILQPWDRVMGPALGVGREIGQRTHRGESGLGAAAVPPAAVIPHRAAPEHRLGPGEQLSRPHCSTRRLVPHGIPPKHKRAATNR
jgi:hypothetical protein